MVECFYGAREGEEGRKVGELECLTGVIAFLEGLLSEGSSKHRSSCL